MKFIVLAISLAFSAAIFAQTPATTAMANLLADGTYKGTDRGIDCSVTISSSENTVSVGISNSDTSKYFVLTNNTITYNVDQVTGEIASSQPIYYPHSMGGGSRVFNAKLNANNEVELYIIDLIIDHRGDDSTSGAECTITK